MPIRPSMRARWARMGAALALVLGVAGCATGPSHTAPTGLLTPVAQQDIALPEASMAAQYHLLAGEMAVQRGMMTAAARHYVTVLKYTSSKQLARRATRIALFAGVPELAYQAVREWAQLAPQALDAQRIAARLAFARGDASAVLDYGRMVVATAQTRRDGYGMLADVLSGSAQREQLAITTLQQLAHEDSDSAAAWYALALVSLRYGQPETAAVAARHARKRAPSWDQAALLQAAIWIRLDQPARAQALIDSLPGSKAQRSQYHLSLAQLLLDGSQPQAALGEFERALALQPDSANARYGLAVLALSLGDMARAEAAFKQLYQSGKRPGESAYYLGTIYARRDAYAQAERWYRRVAAGGHVFTAKVRAARMRARQGELAAARADIEQLRQRYPEMQARLYATEGSMLYAAGRYADALALYNTALAQQPHASDLLYGRSLVYEQLGRIDAARADLRALLQRDPDSARALNALGYLLSNHTTEYHKALRLVSRAMHLQPDNPAILDSMGWVHYRLGHLRKALDYLQRAYAAFPEPEVAAHLGEVLWQMGRHERARAIWQQALSEHPEHTLLKQTIARLTP